VNEETTRPGHGLGSVLCVPFTVLTLMAEWQEGHPAHKKTCSNNSQTLAEQVEEGHGGTSVK